MRVHVHCIMQKLHVNGLNGLREFGLRSFSAVENCNYGILASFVLFHAAVPSETVVKCSISLFLIILKLFHCYFRVLYISI